MATSEVIVAMVPFLEYSRLNQFFVLARFIASRNIPVYFLSLADQNQDLKLRVQSDLKASNIHFNDLLVPSSPSETEATENDGTGVPSIAVLIHKLEDPIRKICLDLSTIAKRLVIIHDNAMKHSMGDVFSFPNVESYIFHSDSAFTRYSLLRQCLDHIVVDDEHDQMVRQLQDNFPRTESCYGPHKALFVRMAHEWKLNSGEFMNSYREVEGKYLDLLLANNEKDKKPMWVVGPLHMLLESHESSDRNRHECLEFLDKQDVNSVIFVSFGTNTKFSQEQINELALGLEQSKHRFIWVLSEADIKMGVEKFEEKDGNKIELPEGFEERVEGRGMVVRNWVSQLEILGHPCTGGFLSDCGWNSCLESISKGVPIAAWPNNADQPYNAVFVTSVVKIGISVWSWARNEELVTATSVEKAVKTLMGTPEGEEVRQRVVELSNKINNSVSLGGPASKEMESFISYITRELC